ncbi:MAG: FixH family protein [Rhodobacteraceae bacterium]|nr:FixH family protein [Paracoccaceae bacterium]
MKDGRLTGRHVALIFASGFTVIVAVNLTLAYSAVRSFPGLEVENSYIASQVFDVNRKAQDALGWDVSAVIEGKMLRLSLEDANGPVRPDITRATLGRATHIREDRDLVFRLDGRAHVAQVGDLGTGNWNLRLKAIAEDGTLFQRRIVLWVRQ